MKGRRGSEREEGERGLEWASEVLREKERGRERKRRSREKGKERIWEE